MRGQTLPWSGLQNAPTAEAYVAQEKLAERLEAALASCGPKAERSCETVAQALLELEGGANRRHNDHIVGRQRVQRHEFLAKGVVQELHAAALEVGVDLWVVNHLTEQENPLARVLIHRLVADLNGIFHPKTEPNLDPPFF